MVEHIEDDLAVDLAKFDSDFFAESIADLLSKGSRTHMQQISGKIKEAVTSCKVVNTKEGFEVCLFQWIEDIMPQHRGGGFKPEREDLFKAINKHTTQIKKGFYYDHTL